MCKYNAPDYLPGKVRWTGPPTAPVSSSEVFLGELRIDDKLRSLASVEEDGPLFVVAVEAGGIFFLTEWNTVGDPFSSLLMEASAVCTMSCLL